MKTFRIIGVVMLMALGIGYMPRTLAETVSQKQASQIAHTFFNAAYGERVSAPKLAWNGKQLTTDRLFSPFYIYNHPKGGFVIVSADSKAYPILGYSKTQNFSRDHLGEAENAQLLKFAREVELIRYDSRVPVRAVDAWQHMPAYIDHVLRTPYDSPEFRALTADEKDDIEDIDRRNGWVIMPSAVEFDIYNASLYRNYTLDDVTAEEEVPFSFFEEFLREIEQEELARAADLEEAISPTRPVVKFLGGAHFEIFIPDSAHLLRVFAMDGSRKIEKYYNDTDIVNVDLSSLSPGFYVAMILSAEGRVYGLKLYR